MSDYSNLIFVDVEATQPTPYSGVMTEFGCVHYLTHAVYHGVLHDTIPNPDTAVRPIVVGEPHNGAAVMRACADWALTMTAPNRPTMVSDNPAFDFMWMAYYFDMYEVGNPFGYSARRIGDFYAGLTGDWRKAQEWKSLRRTPHDHHPVHDAMGNVEAFEAILDKVAWIERRRV